MSLYDPSRNSHSLAESRARLQAQFRNVSSTSTSEQGAAWSRMWSANDFLPFDRGCPNPALAETLSMYEDVLGLPLDPMHRKLALVPGCGRGYDVTLLSAFGYESHGLEVAADAARSAVSQASHELSPETFNSSSLYVPKYPKVGRGDQIFFTGDFFAQPTTWDLLARIGSTSSVPITLDRHLEAHEYGEYDLIYDYTFFCAIPPTLRSQWALQMSKLLKLGGHLICLEFPTTKPAEAGGPPFGVAEQVYRRHLQAPGLELPYSEQGELQPALPEEAKAADAALPQLVRVHRRRAEKTHEVGKGNDWVSIWVRKS